MADEDIKDTNTRDTSTDRGDRGTRDSDRGERHDRSLERNEHRERGRSIRDELRASFAETTGDDERPRRGEPSGRAARQAREATAEPGAAGGAVAPDAGGTGAGAAPDISSPPKSWRADERAHYDQLPPEIKNAVHRREVEMERGVAELKNNYAELDRAIAPHLPVIRQFGHTPGAAVSQLFSWMDFLSKDPLRGFPALVKSMGAEKIFQQHLAAQQQQQGAAQAQQFTPDQQAAQWLQQQIGAHVAPLQQQLESYQMQNTQQILNDFAKDKPHFERVRYRMSTLLQPNPVTGLSVIPLTPEGHVDLLGAYNAAVAMDNELSGQMVAEQVKAKLKAESERAQRARYTSSSLRPASPGSASNTTGAKKRVGGKSVNESIHEAIAELRE